MPPKSATPKVTGTRKTKYVSIWLGQKIPKRDVDLLRDLVGLPYYDLDEQECSCEPKRQITDAIKLAKRISYSKSFLPELQKALQELGIAEARYVLALFNFEYKPKKSGKDEEPRFIGTFVWNDDEDDLPAKYSLPRKRKK